MKRRGFLGALLGASAAFVGLVFTPAAPGQKRVAGERLPWPARYRGSFEFKDAEMRDVVKHVSAITGKNVIVSDKVRGKITILAPTKVNRAQAWRAFRGALALNDLTIFKQGRWWRIVPASEGRGAATQIYDPTRGR